MKKSEMTWPDRLRRLRRRLRYTRPSRRYFTQGDLAKRLGVARSTIGFWETGEHEPQALVLAKIEGLEEEARLAFEAEKKKEERRAG